MTYKDWIKILEENSREDWEWYARWLRDESEDELRARAITEYVINKSPRFSKLTKTYDWWISSYRHRHDGDDGDDVDDVEDNIFKNLHNHKLAFCEHNSIVEAKLALIEAWVSSKTTRGF